MNSMGLNLVKKFMLLAVFILNSVSAEVITFNNTMEANKFVGDCTTLIKNVRLTIDVIEKDKIQRLKEISFEIKKAIKHNKGVKTILEGYGGKSIDKLAKHIDNIDNNIKTLTTQRIKNNKNLIKLIRTNRVKPAKILKIVDKVGKVAYVVDMTVKTAAMVAKYREGSLGIKDTLNFVLDGAAVIDQFYLIEGTRYIEKTFENILDKKRVINDDFIKSLDSVSETIQYFSSKEVVFTRLNGSHKNRLLKAENADAILEVIQNAKFENIKILKQQYKYLTNIRKKIEQKDSRLLSFKLDADEALNKSLYSRIEILHKTIISKINYIKNEDPLVYSVRAIAIITANELEEIKSKILKVNDITNRQIDISDRILKAINKHENNIVDTKDSIDKKYSNQDRVKQPFDISKLTLKECKEKTINKKFKLNRWTTSYTEWNRVHIACLRIFYQIQRDSLSNKINIQNTNNSSRISLYYMITHPNEKLASKDCSVRVFGQTISLNWRGGRLITPEYKLKGWGDISSALRYDLAPANNMMKSIKACNGVRQMMTYGNMSLHVAVQTVVRGYTKENSPFLDTWDLSVKNILPYTLKDIQRAQNKYNTGSSKRMSAGKLSLEQCKVKYHNYGNALWAKAQGEGFLNRGEAAACYQSIVAAPMMGMNGQLFIDQYNKGNYNW